MPRASQPASQPAKAPSVYITKPIHSRPQPSHKPWLHLGLRHRPVIASLQTRRASTTNLSNHYHATTHTNQARRSDLHNTLIIISKTIINSHSWELITHHFSTLLHNLQLMKINNKKNESVQSCHISLKKEARNVKM